ncbi:MAG: hypothetical protein MI807_21125 [Verrucomicrobiales bacterium]|nr:hypothetical protein [Verrucomicrobiales bacterium]
MSELPLEDAAAAAADTLPSRRRKKRSPWKSIVLKLFFAATFLTGLYGSIRLGTEMAMKRIAASTTAEPANPVDTPITLGRPGDPVYLALDRVTLRNFFADYDSPGRRASADLTGLSVRRITSPLQMQATRAEADAVEMKILSGPFAGSVYWVHHTQMPDPSKYDPILSPVPGAVQDREEN